MNQTKCTHCGTAYNRVINTEHTSTPHIPLKQNGELINNDEHKTTTTYFCVCCGKEFTITKQN